jgi:multiple sugar transport system substrate-binding protein
MLAGLSGCGALAETRAQPEANGRPAARVRFLSRDDVSTRRLVDAQVRAFGAQSPAVRVEVDYAADWLGTFQNLVASGAPVDALYHAHDSVGATIRQGLLTNLEPYLSKYREGDVERGAWAATLYDGKRWGLPWDGGAYALVFNADLFVAANLPLPDPRKRMTWDDLLGMASRLTVDGNGKRPTDSGFDPRAVKVHGFAMNSSWGLATFIMSCGGELLVADNKVPVDSPETVEALQFVADLRTKHHVSPTPSLVEGSGPDGVPPSGTVRSFEHGTLAMAYEGSWRWRHFNAAGLRWGAVPAPLRKVPVSGAHFSPLVMARSTQQRDATWAWMAFAALSEEGQRLAVDAGQMQPVRRSLEGRFVEAETPPAAPYRQAFADELKSGTLRVAGDRTGTYWGGYKQQWARLWDHLLQPLYRGEKSASAVAGELRRHTELLLKLGRSPVPLP